MATRWLQSADLESWPEGVKHKADQLPEYVRALADAYMGTVGYNGKRVVDWDTVPTPDSSGEIHEGCDAQKYGVDFVKDDGSRGWHMFPSKAVIMKKGKGDFDAGMEAMFRVINAQKPKD